MSLEIMKTFFALAERDAAAEIEKCNSFTSRFNLLLSHQDALELVETKNYALRFNGRLEFGGEVIEKIIRKFCSSPFLSRHNYAETLHELIEIFYFFKNDTLDLLSDEELIEQMKNSFDGVCQGSLELLAGRELEKSARNLRYGYEPDYSDENENEAEDNDGEY